MIETTTIIVEVPTVPRKIQKGTCKKCGCKFNYYKSRLNTKEEKVLSSAGLTYYVWYKVKCPKCKTIFGKTFIIGFLSTTSTTSTTTLPFELEAIYEKIYK